MTLPLDPDAARNAELFATAVASFREAESGWRQQLALVLGHPTDLCIDYDSLGGRYELLGPFIQIAISGVLAAVTEIAYSPHGPVFKSIVQRILIMAAEAGKPATHTLVDNTLALALPLHEGHALSHAQIVDILREYTVRAAATIPIAPSPLPRMSPPPSPISPSPVDPYEAAADYMRQLEDVLRQNGLWPDDPPPDPLEVRGAFGCENMAFTQWLAWVLIPRVRSIITQRQTFPQSSEVAAYAIRELDGAPGDTEIVHVLAAFDNFIKRLKR